MDGQRLDATVLQLLCQRGDDELLVVPTQTGLSRHGNTDGIDHLLRNLQHLGNVLQHTCTGTLARHFLHGTTEIQVDDVRAGLLDNLGSFNHCIDITAVDLDAYGPFLVTDGQLLHG